MTVNNSDLIGRNFGASLKWDDLRIPVTATTAAGSNPPDFVRFQDNGAVSVGYALVFDGVNDYATIPHADSATAPVFAFDSSWSMAFWAIIPAGNTNNDRLFYHPQWNISINPSNRLSVNLSGLPTQVSSTSFLPGSRTHCVLTAEESGTDVIIKLYFNNALVINTIVAGSLAVDAGGNVIVGAESPGVRNTNFTVDDIRFYNSVLTAANVVSLYNAGVGTEGDVEPGNTISHYPCNAGSGVSALDAIYPGPTTHTMTLTNGVAWTNGLAEVSNAAQGVFAYAFSPDVEQELFFTVQLPHTWIEYAEIHPHVHWSPSDNVAGNVVWGLEWSWANIGTPFGQSQVYTVVAPAGGKNYHLLAEFTELLGTTKLRSSMLVCRVFRKAADVADTYANYAYLIEIDFHYQTLNQGSPDELAQYGSIV